MYVLHDIVPDTSEATTKNDQCFLLRTKHPVVYSYLDMSYLRTKSQNLQSIFHNPLLYCQYVVHTYPTATAAVSKDELTLPELQLDIGTGCS